VPAVLAREGFLSLLLPDVRSRSEEGVFFRSDEQVLFPLFPWFDCPRIPFPSFFFPVFPARVAARVVGRRLHALPPFFTSTGN